MSSLKDKRIISIRSSPLSTAPLLSTNHYRTEKAYRDYNNTTFKHFLDQLYEEGNASGNMYFQDIKYKGVSLGSNSGGIEIRNSALGFPIFTSHNTMESRLAMEIELDIFNGFNKVYDVFKEENKDQAPTLQFGDLFHIDNIENVRTRWERNTSPFGGSPHNTTTWTFDKVINYDYQKKRPEEAIYNEIKLG